MNFTTFDSDIKSSQAGDGTLQIVRSDVEVGTMKPTKCVPIQYKIDMGSLASKSVRGRAVILAMLGAAFCFAAGQTSAVVQLPKNQEKPSSDKTLTMADAIRQAEAENGTIAAALANYHSSIEQRIESFAAFLPTVTPSYQYNSDREIFRSAGVYSAQQTEGGSSQIAFQWQLLDSGQREDNYKSAQKNEDSAYYNSLQTLRQTVFDVQKQYYETLRAQELLKVANSQVDRTKTILSQTEAAVANGATAKIAILQATADFENAKVSALQAENSVSTNSAQLKSLIGYPAEEQLPTLEKASEPTISQSFPKLDQFLNEGIKNRPDLKANRYQIESLGYAHDFLEKQAGINLSLNANYTETLTPYTLQSRFFTLSLSYPLFDGGSSRAAARASKDQETAAKKSYEQSVRSAKSEIESAYLTVEQDLSQVSAAKSALTAAQANYTQTVQSQALGSSNLIDVLTAQVSLVTAESNYIQAEYDYDEAELSLRLATGRPLYGVALS